MSWRAITESDLQKKISNDELTALRAAGLADGQADPIAGHITDVTNLVRGYIAANRANTMGAEATLPERIIPAAVDYMVIDVGSRVAGLLIDLNGTRKTAHENAVRLFRDIAAGSFAVEEPVTASTEEESAPSPSTYTRTRDFTRDTEDGI